MVNTSNRPGTNIPMDLHLEHLNRQLKTALRNMGSNITDSSVTLAAQSIDVVNHVCAVFESSTDHKADSGLHSSPSFERDYKLVLSVLNEKEVFSYKPKRQHGTFKNRKSLFQQMDYKGLLQWIKRTTVTLTK